MTERTYVNKGELDECFIIAAVLTGLEVVAKNAPSSMKQYLDDAYESVSKAWQKRLSFVEETEKIKLRRRLDHVQIVAKQKGVDFSTEYAKATVNECDLMDLADCVAMVGCKNCTKSEKDCKYAQIFNRLCLPCVDGAKSCRYAIKLSKEANNALNDSKKEELLNEISNK